MFGEDITTAAREAAAKRKPKAEAEGEATPEDPVAETVADKDVEVLADEELPLWRLVRCNGAGTTIDEGRGSFMSQFSRPGEMGIERGRVGGWGRPRVDAVS